MVVSVRESRTTALTSSSGQDSLPSSCDWPPLRFPAAQPPPTELAGPSSSSDQIPHPIEHSRAAEERGGGDGGKE